MARDSLPNNNRSNSRSDNCGATVSQVSFIDGLRSWFSHHKNSAGVSLQKLMATPLQSLMTWLVIGIALALPSGLFLLIDNVQSLGERWDGDPKITVFLHHETESNTAMALQKSLMENSAIENIEYVSPEKALNDFKNNAGFGKVLDLLDENPLPPVFIVTPKIKQQTTEALQQLADELSAFDEVEFVQLDLEWVQKLQQIIAFGHRFAFLLGILLSLGILLTIGNTIRLAIESRREEIVVVKLVGGTDAFVRRPLLYSGIWYGLIGGVMACLMILTGTLALSGPIGELSALYGSDFSIRGLSLIGIFYLLLTSTLLGLLGSWLAVSRHLHLIQPR